MKVQGALSISTMTFFGPAGITYGKPTLPEFSWKYFEKVVMKPEVPLRLAASQEFSDNPWHAEPEQTMRFEPNPGWSVYRKSHEVPGFKISRFQSIL